MPAKSSRVTALRMEETRGSKDRAGGIEAAILSADALDDRIAIVGTAGSGKTYAAKGFVERLLESGARVAIENRHHLQENRHHFVVHDGDRGTILRGRGCGRQLQLASPEGDDMPLRDDPLIVPCPHCDTFNRVARARLGQGGRCGACHQPLFTGRPLALGKDRFARHLDRGDLPLLIDFWAPWCGPCRAMAPQFERAAAELEPDIRLVKINVDDEPELAQRFAVSGVPTVVLAFHGRELARRSGAAPAAELVRWTRSGVAQAASAP